MQYYILRHENIDGGFVDGDVAIYPNPIDYYEIGKEILTPETTASVTLDKRVKKLRSEFFLTTCGAFFVSEQMKEVLEQHKSNINFFLADVSYYSGKTTEQKYLLIHTSDKIPCFDYLNSDYSGKPMVLKKLDSGELGNDYKVRGIKKFCIKESECGDLDFFFIDKIIWIDPLISERIANAAKERNIQLNIEKIFSTQS
ncbi:imm11 family protein [Pseudomonas viridiflava]|uniref:imm11 family protein n=1 Tax=Pseudomonas viridiflava TaxID=33069 RepID=UPI0018E6599B|nr:DUF1629 domain-containing protein [Pseudomonas viridiflava]MBI6703382.1 hypothetical protein [Pseudomonas viridiflava]MBI6724785.1 hypothetical protein [Pseudomonas viridiflava]